jgi:hypothetical protein
MPIVKVERRGGRIEPPHLVDRNAEALADQVVQRGRERGAGRVVVGEQRFPAALGGLELEGIIRQRAGVGAERRQDRLRGLTVKALWRRLAPPLDPVIVAQLDQDGTDLVVLVTRDLERILGLDRDDFGFETKSHGLPRMKFGGNCIQIADSPVGVRSPQGAR